MLKVSTSCLLYFSYDLMSSSLSRTELKSLNRIVVFLSFVCGYDIVYLVEKCDFISWRLWCIYVGDEEL